MMTMSPFGAWLCIYILSFGRRSGVVDIQKEAMRGSTVIYTHSARVLHAVYVILVSKASVKIGRLWFIWQVLSGFTECLDAPNTEICAISELQM